MTCVIIFNARRVIVSDRLALFAILTIHFMGSVIGTLRSSSRIINLQCLAKSLRFRLLAPATSLSVLGISISLHETYTAALIIAEIDLPRVNPLSWAFLYI